MSIKIYSGLLVVMLILAFCENLFAQNWNFEKEKDGIKIYTRKEFDSNLNSFKGEAYLHTSLDKVYAMIGNIENVDWWDEDIRDLKILSHKKNCFVHYYLVYDVPWPLADRDLCVQAHITTDDEKGQRIVYTEPLLDVIPEKPNLIRIKKYWQRWTIQDIGNGVVHITLEGFVDPAGSVPAWLYNMVLTETPLKIIRGIKKRVETE